MYRSCLQVTSEMGSGDVGGTVGIRYSQSSCCIICPAPSVVSGAQQALNKWMWSNWMFYHLKMPLQLFQSQQEKGP